MIFAQLKQFATSVVLTLSIVFSFGMSMPAAAMVTSPMEGMAHESTAITNCLDQHHIAPGVVRKSSINNLKNEDDEPSPLPYFVQFQTRIVEKLLTAPTDIVCSSSYQPPDIIRLTSNIRF